MNNKLNNNFSLRKLLLTALVAGPLATLPAPLWALPSVATSNLTTSSGVTTQVVGSTLNVTAPDKAVLTWQAFGSGASTIAAGDTINYFLPSAASSVLNSVSGGALTTIDGSLISNGNVYILNSAGIVISPTAQINTGGFYASTVAEPSGFFGINGTLSFAGTSTNNIVVQGTGTTSGTDTATIQAVGPGNNIYLAGNAIDIQGGKFFGNLFVRSSSTANPLGGASTRIGNMGQVSVNLVGSPLVGGGLNIATNGGAAQLSDVGRLLIAPSVSSTTGAVVVNTTGQSGNGSITQGAGAVTASTSGTVVTLNAGTTGAITLGNADFATVGATGKDISLTDTAGGVVLAAITAAGNLTVGSAGSITQVAGTTHSVGGTIALTPTAGSTVSFTGTGNLSFTSIAPTGTITVVSTGDITLPAITSTSTMTLTSSGGSITAAGITSSTLSVSAANLTVNGPLQSAAATITSAGNITVTGTQTITGGTSNVTATAGSITLGGLTTSSTVNLTATAGSISTGAVTNSGNPLTLTANNGTVTTLGVTGSNSLTVAAGAINMGAITTTANTSLTASTGSITTTTINTSSTLSLSAPSSGGTITTGAIVSTTTRTVTLSSGGTLDLKATTAPVLSVTSTGGSITQSGIVTSTSAATLNAAADITLALANDFKSLVVLGGSAASSGAAITDANTVIIGSTTNYRGATAITTTTGPITLGNSAIDTITFGSNLTLTANGGGAITTNANNVTVFGNVNLVTTGAATLGNNIFGNAANYQFGQIQATVGGALSVFENTTLNLGKINAASLDARSLAGDIVNTGAVTVTGATILAANSIFSPGTVTLNNAGNAISGTVFIGNAKDFTLVNTGNTTVTAGTALVNGKAVTGTTNVTVTGGTLTMNTGVGGDYSTVGFNASGDVTITDPNGLTLQNASSTGTGLVSVTAAGPIVLGSGIALGSTALASFTSTGASAGISDSAPNVRIFGPASFTSDNSISITNTGHSLGAVSLATTGANTVNGTSNITYTEGGTANLNVVSITPTTGPNGSLTVVSTGGNVMQTPVTGSISVPTTGTGTNTVSFTSSAGSVSLNNPAGTNNIVPVVALSAVANSSVSQGQTLRLGNVAVSGGTFSANTSASTGKTITQAASTSIKAFGNTSFTTSGAKITVANTGNNFGGLTLVSNTGVSATASSAFDAVAGTVTGVTSVVVGTGYAPSSTFAVTLTGGGGAGATATATTNAAGAIASYAVTAPGAGYTSAPTVTVATTPALAGADVAITEGGVLNLRSVNTGTAGKFTATSENASIIQTGTGGVTVGGATTLTAAADGIMLNTGTTSNAFGGNSGILVTTPGNVSIQDASLITTIAGGTNIGGTLVLKNNTALSNGTIKDSPGNLTVSGNVLLDTTTTAASSINIGSANVSFGALQFRSGTVTVVENATLNLGAGSVASGAVNLTSSGNIITSGFGGGTFQSSLTLNAGGAITITNPIFVNSGLTFRALGAVDLSALSLAGNLNSINPTNLGASTYKAPSP